MTINSVKLAKWVMRMREALPTPPEDRIGDLQEVFNHQMFVQGSEHVRREVMLRFSESKYQGEMEYPWDAYFGIDLAPLLSDKIVLDLGCLVGGRSVAWSERYGIREIHGIDVHQDYIDAANQFAALKGVNASFQVAKGESLPFADHTFDAVLSFDVFEHVRSVQRTLEECYRVLRSGGRLFVVFPSYYQPDEHHLGLVSKFPGIQYFFSGRTLVKAYQEILDERGRDADWYKRGSSALEPWEKGNTINGTTLRQFRKMIDQNRWKTILWSSLPIGSIGRNLSGKMRYKILSRLFHPLVFVPGLQEIFLHRITYILEKRSV